MGLELGGSSAVEELLLLKQEKLVLLLLEQNGFPFQEPLWIAFDLVIGYLLGDARLVGSVRPLLQLFLIGLLVKPVHFTHLLDLIQVHNEATLVRMVFLDALAAKYREVVGAIEVLHALIVLIAQQAVDALFVLKVNIP